MTLLAMRAGSRARLPAGLVVVIVAGLSLAILAPWRTVVMNLNGDEPHYYVTARSIGEDGDLELLDDYLDPQYMAETISPTGNIAVERETGIDRYRPLVPGDGPGGWYLVPSGARLVTSLAGGIVDADRVATARVSTADGHEESLPPLTAASRIVIPFSGPCQLSEIWIGSPGQPQAEIVVEARDASGSSLWREDGETERGVARLTQALEGIPCDGSFAGSVTVEANVDVIAEVVDRRAGLRVLAGSPAAADWLLGPLPRDRFATREATARLVVHNPLDAPVKASIRLLMADDSVLRATSVTVGAQGTVAIDLDVPAGAAVTVEGDAPLVVGGSGWLAGGSYGLPTMVHASAWTVDV
ncbi:MAG: hypothetical protein ACRD1H_09745, partial [Vicinamibacterales bacterium]